MSRGAIRFFAWLWRFIRWFWGVVVAGIAVGVIVAAIATGLSNAAAVLSWPVGVALALALLLTLCAGRAHRQQQAASPYVLKRIERLDPTNDFYVPRYVASAYLPRPADAAAREALRRAAQRTDHAPTTEPLGICIVGRPTQGKTRLAWEAMRAELTGWTLVKWSHHPLPFDFPTQRAGRVVLAIDDVQEYASNPAEVTTLTGLPEAFREVDAHLVIVVTCRDGDDWDHARQMLGKLLERLTPVYLTDITAAQADQLAALLREAGEAVQRDQFDHTPGSLLLGVVRMRDERYPALPEPAKKILRVLKLLRSATIYGYPAPRVRATAADLFHLAESDWSSARDALLRAGFLRLGELDEHHERALVPVADVYLERTVPDYPAPCENIVDYWPLLEQSLIERRDFFTFNQLGIAFNKQSLGNLLSNQSHAETCFRAALHVYTYETTPIPWAGTQNNLGEVFFKRASLVSGQERVALLRRAVAAYQEAQKVFTPEEFPLEWAGTQHNLGNAQLEQARLAKREDRAHLLKQVVEIYRSILEVRERMGLLVDWAATQNSLGLALKAQAELAGEGECLTLLSEAGKAHQAAAAVYQQEGLHAKWAGVQNNLGNVFLSLAQRTVGEEHAQFVQQAVETYRAPLDVDAWGELSADWAMTQTNLGGALSTQALLVEGKERAELLSQALAAHAAALNIYTLESTPIHWAQTQQHLGDVFRMRAPLVEGAQQIKLLKQSEAAYQAALGIYTQEHTPETWIWIRYNLALTHAARVALEKKSDAVVCQALREAQRYADFALPLFKESNPGYYQQIIQGRETLEAGLQTFDCKPEG